MSIQNIRIGDTVISEDGDYFEVIEKDWDFVKAKPVSLTPRRLHRKTRKFKHEKLFCVDLDDGLWQETIN